ncbi:Crp/Fnr family transcriptional regulator [Chryseobacterium potabilaquae]|uniref:cAMP-activated global transcriptional regulator CRP n=1 Tax=Chryseobacterium potabilaquae TaxID=2675057 RepID=A0A6N4X812_9FLAO|nr:Crp/Fnr family transcriptional regulator [Chryseobacterium potabilaquae]CAA7196889.1 cAMP-activated global transcriptional regulator CRP [Chryseobacterium potabilaquae]
MLINEQFLSSVGAETIEYNNGEYIFHEGNSPRFYYFILEGEVKLNNFNQDGKELILNIFTQDQSFGEFCLFTEKLYTIGAVAITNCRIMRLHKECFMDTLKHNPQLYLDLCKNISECMDYQYTMLKNNSSLNPSERIMGIMLHFKSFEEDQFPFSFKIPFTRQQLASFTGLRIETTIRTIKIMEKDKIVKMKDRKIYFYAIQFIIFFTILY